MYRVIFAAAAVLTMGAAAPVPAPVAQTMANPPHTVVTGARGRDIMSIWRDPETGCDYFLSLNTTTPRLKADGLPYCVPPG